MAKKKKLDPKSTDYMRELGRKGGNATKANKPKNYFKRLALKSHPRAIYKGGRPKNPVSTPQ